MGPVGCGLGLCRVDPTLLHCDKVASWELALEGVGWWALGLARRGYHRRRFLSPWRSASITEGVIMAVDINGRHRGGRLQIRTTTTWTVKAVTSMLVASRGATA